MTWRFAAVAAVLSASVAMAPSSAESQTRTTVEISKERVERLMNRALGRFRIHVDNLGDRHGGSWLQNDSRVAISIGGDFEIARSFDVPERRFRISTVGGRDLMFYVADFNSADGGVRGQIQRRRGGNLILDIAFESEKDEIVGKCRTRRGLPHRRRWAECRLDIDRNAQIDDARLRLWAPIEVRDGRLSLGDSKGNFRSSVRINSRLCALIRQRCSDFEAETQTQLAREIVGSAKAALDQARDRVERVFRRADDALSIRGARVLRLEDLGDRYRVTIRLPQGQRTNPSGS